MTQIRFQDALPLAIEFVEKNYAVLGKEPVLVRDIFGRISIILHGKKNKNREKLDNHFAALLKNFAYSAEESNFIYTEDLFSLDGFINSPDKIEIPESNPPIYLLDRQITGQDWLRQPIHENQHPPRVTLFGIKGGVGCSTALAVWAWYLADKLGKKVLVIDLDLESPGIGSILLPMERMPDFGVVDWLVEEAVGQADDELLREMVARSPLSEKGEGEIRVVCAAGSKEQDYIAKLSRVYMDINHDGEQLDFAHRLSLMLEQLEAQEKPDIVLLDSRAGIHDIAAIAITRLTDLALLFAVNTPQTWQAYHYLFSHWQKWNKNLTEFRNNLKVVAAMIPELGREDYVARLNESSYNLFAETIYEKTDNDELDCFNFDVSNNNAPHYRIPILWNSSFQEFNPLTPHFFEINAPQIIACYEQFLDSVTKLISWNK
jgi:hypothetical protein